MLKVIEVLASSKKGWEDAAQNAVSQASNSVKKIRSINVQNMSASVKGGKVQEYRINAKITFELNE